MSPTSTPKPTESKSPSVFAYRHTGEVHAIMDAYGRFPTIFVIQADV